MISFFAIVLVAALNLIPADTTNFTLQIDEKPDQAIHFVRQDDEGWKATSPTGEDMGVFHVDGTKLTNKAGDKTNTMDLGDTLNLKEGTNWKELKELKVGAQLMKIEHKKDGIDFVLKYEDDGAEATRTIRVRWGAKTSD